MPQNFFVTGKSKTGKTTVVRRLVEDLKSKGLMVGGFVSPASEIRGSRSEFYIEDIETGKRGLLASTRGSGVKVSKYYVNIPNFEKVALPSMKKVDDYDVIVVDEIGHMEMRSTKFNRILDSIFESQTPVIASLNKDYVDQFSAGGDVLMLTRANQEVVYRDLLDKTLSAYTGVPRKKPEKKTIPKKRGKKQLAKAEKKSRTRKKSKKRSVKKDSVEEAKQKEEEKPANEGIVGYIKDLLGF